MRRPRSIGRRAGRVLRAGALGVAVGVAGFGPPAAIALQQQEEERGGTVTADVALRAEADEGAEVLAVVPNGARVVIDGRAEEGYYPVRYDDLDGWVATGYLASSLDDDPPPAADAEAADASAVAAQDAVAEPGRDGEAGRAGRDRGDDVITTEELNLRAAPTDGADVLRTIAAGDEVVPTGERDGDFVEVRHDGATGWVAFAYLATRRAPTPAELDPSPARGPRSARTVSEAELIRVISDAAAYYGQPRQDMLRVARCESQLTPTAVNPRTGDSGLFQFNPDTWRSTPYGRYDIFDPAASAYAAGWMWSVGRRNEWVCQ